MRVITEYTDYPKARKVIEVYKMIRNGTAKSQEQLSHIFDVSPSTIKKYIAELRNIWGAEIVYKGKKYILVKEGILGCLKTTYPLSHYDVFILLSTLMQVYPFIEAKFEIIKEALISILPDEENEKFYELFKGKKNLVESNPGMEDTLRKVMQSILTHHKARITYRNSKGEVKIYIYRPYTLACDQGKYYLIVRRDDKDYIQHLRLDQISRIEVLEKTFKSVKELEISDYLRKTWYMYSGDETKVRVRFTSDCKKVVLERSMGMGQIIEEDETHFVYEFICNGTDGIKLWLMGFMDKAEILEPLALREEIKEKLVQMIKHY